MSNRRMLSNKIIDSARFIKMPISSQCLYFHLIAKGDDDGIVEAFNVMKMVGATEDDLKVLVAKGFVVVLNEDLVSYITDWKEHNLIRADRKVDSIYKDLLLQIVPEADLLEAKPSYYQRKKELSDICQTNDRIRQDKISKDNNICPNDIHSDDINDEKIKENERLEYNFNIIWEEYPRKEGKTKTFSYYKQYLKGRRVDGKMYKLTNEQMLNAVIKYAEEVKGTEKKYIKQGSTFFNLPIVDYISEE